MTLRKNVGSQKLPFALIKASDGTALTGASVTARISLDGATQATATGTVSELANGQYVWSPAQADTNANSVGVLFTATNAIPVHFTIYTTASDPTDSVRLGLTALPNVAAGASGGLPTGDASGRVAIQSGTGTGQLDVTSGVVKANATQLGGATVTATTSVTFPAASTVATTTGAVGSVTGAVGSVTGAVGSVTAAVTVGTNNDKTGYSLSSAGIQAIWDALTSALTTVGSIGKLLVDNVNATISSRLASASITLSSGAVTVGTNNDKSGYSLSSAGIQAVWDALTSALTTVGSIGKRLADNVDAAISSRLASASYTAPLDAAGTRSAIGLATANLDSQLDALPTAAETATAVRSELTTELGRLDVAVSTRLAASSYTTPPTASANATAVRSELTTELGRIDASVSSRLASASYTAPLDAAGTRSALGLASANLDTQIDAIPTAAETADAVWDEAISGHLTAGSTGAALNAAGAAGDPWSTSLPGAYGAGTAGKIVGDNLNATVSSRLASASYIAPLDAAGTRTALGLASANLDTQLDALPTAGEVADAVWDEVTSGHVSNGTYGERVLRSTTAQSEVAITGSHHVAADIHELQVGVLTAEDFAADAITAAAVASDVGTEIASAVRTNLTTELGRIDVTTSSRASQTSVDTLAGYVDTEVGAIKAKTDNLPSDPADQSAVEAAITGLLTTQMTESYNADGVAPTVAQALFGIMQRLTEFSISGTTITVKRLDGSTTAFSLTLDDAASPTSSTRT